MAKIYSRTARNRIGRAVKRIERMPLESHLQRRNFPRDEAQSSQTFYARAKTNWYWGGATPPLFHPGKTPSDENSTVLKGGQTFQPRCNYVIVHLADDCLGTVIATQPEGDAWWVTVNKGVHTDQAGLLVYLPTIGWDWQQNPTNETKMPNVIVDNIIVVTKTQHGEWVAPQDGRWLHETNWFPSSFRASTMQGWAAMDGTLNSHDNGGSGNSMGDFVSDPCDGLFPRQGVTGSNRFTADGGRSTIPQEELRHRHNVPRSVTGTFASSSGVREYLESDACTGEMIGVYDTVAGPCGSRTHTGPVIPVSGSDCGSEDPMGPWYTEPPYRTGSWFEAIDNSQTHLDAVA